MVDLYTTHFVNALCFVIPFYPPSLWHPPIHWYFCLSSTKLLLGCVLHSIQLICPPCYLCTAIFSLIQHWVNQCPWRAFSRTLKPQLWPSWPPRTYITVALNGYFPTDCLSEVTLTTWQPVCIWGHAGHQFFSLVLLFFCSHTGHLLIKAILVPSHQTTYSHAGSLGYDYIYRIRGNFGSGFNLAIWRLKSLLPNFKLANSILYQTVSQCVMFVRMCAHDCTCTCMQCRQERKRAKALYRFLQRKEPSGCPYVVHVWGLFSFYEGVRGKPTTM